MIPDEHERRLEDQWTYLHFKTTMNFSMAFLILKSSWMNFAGFSNQSYYACFSFFFLKTFPDITIIIKVPRDLVKVWRGKKKNRDFQ
jgi:hypothetical protein